MMLKKEVRLAVAPAGMFRRLLAFVFDVFILDIFIATPFKALIASRMPKNLTLAALKTLSPDSGTLLMTFFIFMLFFLYVTILQYTIGQTAGMFLFSINVISTDPDRPRLTAWQVIARNLFLIPLFPLFVLWIIEPVYLLLRKARFTEMVSMTSTIYRTPVLSFLGEKNEAR